MIRRLVSIAAVLLLAACGAEPTGPMPSPAMWEVTDKAGHTGWLFGTVHALPEGTAWRTPLLADVLAKSDLLVVEVSDLGATNIAEQAFVAMAASPNQPPILSRVPPPDRPALAAAIERAGMDEGDFANTETWAAALQIANVRRSGQVENGVDVALLATGKRVYPLESFARQFAIFDHLAEADQRVLLAETAKAQDSNEEQQMVTAWAKGDTQALRREIDTGFLTDPELHAALLVDRNRDWADQIVSIFSKGRSPLIAVGTAHLLGPEGLPALLEERGFTVKRIQ